MKVYLAADHAGYELKNQLREHLHHEGYQVEDVGALTLDEDDDYPRYAYAAAIKLIGGNDDDRAVLICGSGQGMSIAANRVRGVRAALAWNEATARASRKDDNANALILPARFISQEEAFKSVDVWLKTEFSSDPKYHRRLDELEDLYG
jgi:ribose 5-phosphate isomerase B